MELDQKEIESIKESIRVNFNYLVDASKSLDFDRYLEFIDKELFSGLNADGTVFHGREELDKTYRPGFSMVEKIESLEFTNVKITVINKTTAILVNEYSECTLMKNGEKYSSEGGGCQVWSLRSNSWKLVSISSSTKN